MIFISRRPRNMRTAVFVARKGKAHSTTLRSLKTLTTLGSLRSLENPHCRAKQGSARQYAQAQKKNHMPRRTARNRTTQHASRPRNMRTAVFLCNREQRPFSTTLRSLKTLTTLGSLRSSGKAAKQHHLPPSEHSLPLPLPSVVLARIEHNRQPNASPDNV